MCMYVCVCMCVCYVCVLVEALEDVVVGFIANLTSFACEGTCLEQFFLCTYVV